MPKDELMVKTTWTIPKDLHRQLKIRAAMIDVGMNDLVIRAITEHLALHERAHRESSTEKRRKK